MQEAAAQKRTLSRLDPELAQENDLLEALHSAAMISMRMLRARATNVSMIVIELRSDPMASMKILSILMRSAPSLRIYDKPL